MRKFRLAGQFIVGALVLITHWALAIDAFQNNQIFAYQNYWGAPQEKYTLILMLTIGTVVYFILLGRQFWSSEKNSHKITPAEPQPKTISHKLYEARTKREEEAKKRFIEDQKKKEPFTRA